MSPRRPAAGPGSPAAQAAAGVGADPDKCERILDAALLVFAERGVHGTPVPPIANKAGVGVGTLYRYFDSKEALVNAVFQRAKSQLQDQLLDGLDVGHGLRALFDDLWSRLCRFADANPEAFRFLEMQDHHSYLDAASRATEWDLLERIRDFLAQAQRAGLLASGLRPDVAIAMAWGAFVGLIKAQRLGYLKLEDADFIAARDACWRSLAQREGD